MNRGRTARRRAGEPKPPGFGHPVSHVSCMRSLGFAALHPSSQNQRLWYADRRSATHSPGTPPRRRAGGRFGRAAAAPPTNFTSIQAARQRPRAAQGAIRSSTPNAVPRFSASITPRMGRGEGQPPRCAALPPESSFASQPGSRVNLDRTAGPELGDNSARTPLETARLAGDQLSPAFPIH